MTSNHRVCIIDDDEAIRESLCLLLSAAGISSHVFDSANAFLEHGRTAFRLHAAGYPHARHGWI